MVYLTKNKIKEAFRSFAKTVRRDDVAMLVNTVGGMFFNVGTQLSHKPPHPLVRVRISNTVIPTKREATLHYESVLRLYEYSRDINTQRGGRGGVTLHEKKPSTSICECTFVQDNSRVSGGEKKKERTKL